MQDDFATGPPHSRAESFRRNARSVFEGISFQDDGRRGDGDVATFAYAGSRTGHQASIAHLQPFRQCDINAAAVLRANCFSLDGSAWPFHHESATSNDHLSAALTADIHRSGIVHFDA